MTEAPYSELLRDCEERVEVLLLHVNFSLVHEVQDGGQVTGGHVLNMKHMKHDFLI